MKEMCVNEKSYEVIRLLGHGKGGYSYLVTDGTKEYVLKQIHHEPCDYYQFGNKIESEMRDYERLKETTCVTLAPAAAAAQVAPPV